MSDATALSQRWRMAAVRRGGWALALWPLTALYALLWCLRRLWWHGPWARIERLSVPVLVVGNVVVGGAGKTPTTLAILKHLQHKGWRPGVVSRGYGRQSRDTLEVAPDAAASLSGDEPLLIRRRTGVPVVVGADRVTAARLLLQLHPEVNLIVCDDGLQHWRLHRDLAVVVFDPRGTGNGWLLPSGLLREPWPVRHRFAPHLVLQHSDTPSPSPAPASDLPTFHAQRRLADSCHNSLGESCALSVWANQPCSVITGIAQPERFVAMLNSAGVHPALSQALPDHASVDAWLMALRGVKGAVLCTEKDLVKLRQVLLPEDACRVWAVPLELALPSAFLQSVEQRLGATAQV